jgi:sarcosine oxidase
VTEHFDAIVVGGGAMGTAAARNLALRGRRTLVLERFTFGHAEGSSGGPTRIFRLVYEVPDYIEIARLARAAWDELQEAAGEELLRVTGGIEIDRGPAVVEALTAAGVPFERLTPDAVHERWPAIRLPDGAQVVYQADGGVVSAERTVKAQARLAADAGATLIEGNVVTEVMPATQGVRVTTSDEQEFVASVAVVSAGAWAGPLLRSAGVDLPLVPTLEQVSYFDLDRAEPLPSLIDWGADRATPPYLVPDPWEPGRFKGGLHHSGPVVDPDAPRPAPDPARLARVASYVDQRLAPHRATGVVDTCLYTNTPDEDFVLDRMGPLVVASPCSGHGFKFTPLIGAAIADLATGTSPPFPLTRFRIDRPGLRS